MAQLQEVRPKVYADASNKVDARPDDPFSHLWARRQAVPPHGVHVHLTISRLVIREPIDSVQLASSEHRFKRTPALATRYTFYDERKVKGAAACLLSSLLSKCQIAQKRKAWPATRISNQVAESPLERDIPSALFRVLGKSLPEP